MQKRRKLEGEEGSERVKKEKCRMLKNIRTDAVYLCEKFQ